MTFAQWLHAHDYRSSTITASLRDAKRIRRCAAERIEPHRRLRPTAKRLLAWADIDPEALDATEREVCAYLCEVVQTRKLGGHAKRTRKRKAESWPDGEWAVLVAEIRADRTVPGAVLRVLSATALRIGDVLRIDVPELRVGLRRGRLILEVKGGKARILDPSGASEAWHALVLACDDALTVASAVSPDADGNPEADGAAYRVVSRKLARLAKQARTTGRAHLHRLRRTVAVQALRVSGGDIEAVRRLLGHESIQTTRAYLDEATPEQDAALARELRARFAPGGAS